MMFDVPWSQVTEDMIEVRAKQLASRTGGWVWHRKWDGTQLPHMKVQRSQPKIMEEK